MPKRILLADDSITIQKVVELTFSDGDYEVTAVNNGAKAIQKLAEMRPDIILSDIIMPEKNGYEVCEYVKSHPEHRTIPVILLTGTFEPFDPDRADKAGCDAVVTKPFESQSLIHKVEELIEQSRSAPPAPPAASAAPQATPFASEPEPAADPFATNSNDIFSAPPAPPQSSTTEMPFETATEPAFGGETRAFPRMSFEEMQKMAGEPAAAPQAPPPPEPSPWDEPPSPAFGGETRAFPRMSFEEMQKMAGEPAAPQPPPPPVETSPWDEQPAAPSGSETRAFPTMSFDELEAAANKPAAPAPSPAIEPSLWDEPPTSGGETRAFPSMSFDELQRMATEPAEVPTAPQPAMPSAAETPFDSTPPPAAAESSPWDEQTPAFGGETRAFPRMTFDELQQLAGTGAPPASEPSPWEEPATPPPESPFAASEPPAAVSDVAEPAVNSQITDAATAPAGASGDLTNEQIDRIARRVVEIMSEQVVRNIAWEVIPDLAEIIVKERIRQLESES